MKPALVNLTARYVFPADRPPLREGVVTIAGEHIVAVEAREDWERSGASASLLELGNVALLPGLVNAHTHLEFSDLERPLGSPGMRLCDWIGEVIRYRQERGNRRVDAARQGLLEGLRTGTTTWGEIATPPWPPEEFLEAPLPPSDVLLFLELIGLSRERREELRKLAHAFVAGGSHAPNWRVGLSPHAPYSARREVVEDAAMLAGAASPLAMHLAESPEELQLLAEGKGPFVDLLKARGVWDPGAFPPGGRPLDYLRLLSRARRVLVIHGNFLRTDELEFLGEHRDRFTLVYCPRTHLYFRHPVYPLEQALKLGVRIALGTDSRASNPDLNVLEEMRQVARSFPAVSLERILRMGTLDAAWALGLDEHVGSLAPGKIANLVAISLPAGSSSDPHDLLLRGTGQAMGVWQRGKPFSF